MRDRGGIQQNGLVDELYTYEHSSRHGNSSHVQSRGGAAGTKEARRNRQGVFGSRSRRILQQILFVVATLAAIRYLAWRVCCSVSSATLWFFVLFLVAELLAFFEAAFLYFTAWNPTHHRFRPPLPDRTVDIFITTYNEPVYLVRETALCSMHIRYPHKTYILDDGDRPEMKQLADELGCFYISRTSRSDAKAGNLNNALFGSTDGEFIVLLDADHVPTPDLIDSTLGLFADPRVAVVQTPQDFYNLDSFQHQTDWKQEYSWQQQELFFSVIQPGKDYWNAALFCGSPAIARRSALKAVGGFATGTVTEDFHTSVRLQALGYRVVYFNCTVARGLAPQTFGFFSSQWLRWGQGAMQILRQEKPLSKEGLSLPQKLCFFSSVYFYWMSYQKLIYLFTPLFSALTGVFPLQASVGTFWLYFGPYFALNLAASVSVFRDFKSLFLSEQFTMIKLHVMLKTVFGLRKGERKFVVTPKTHGAGSRWLEVWPQLLILIFACVAIVVGFTRLSRVTAFSLWATAFSLFWAFYFLAITWPIVRRALRKREARAAYRFDQGLNVTVVFETIGDGSVPPEKSFARNMNRLGLSITLPYAIPIGSLLRMEIQLPDTPIHAIGKVMRNDDLNLNSQVKRVMNGIKFEQIEVAEQDAISRYLFTEIAPKKGQLLHLTSSTQEDEDTITRT